MCRATRQRPSMKQQVWAILHKNRITVIGTMNDIVLTGHELNALEAAASVAATDVKHVVADQLDIEVEIGGEFVDSSSVLPSDFWGVDETTSLASLTARLCDWFSPGGCPWDGEQTYPDTPEELRSEVEQWLARNPSRDTKVLWREAIEIGLRANWSELGDKLREIQRKEENR